MLVQLKCSVFAPVALTFVLIAGQLYARPAVSGFERFHKEKPDANGGAVLYSELGCANCHGGSAIEIPRSGPTLVDLSRRVRHEWVVEFLSSPEHGRKGSNMPAMFDHLSGKEKAQAIESVAAWLGSLKGKLKIKAARHANAERGSALFHEIGCVACHVPTPDYKAPGAHPPSDALPGHLVSLPDLNRKTSLTGLAAFMSNPSAFRPDGRMPHIQIDERDSVDLAAHLLDYQASDPRLARQVEVWPKATKAQVAEGRAIVESLNCAACHQIPGVEAAEILPLQGAPELPGGNHCLSGDPAPGVPSYGLDTDQVRALVEFLKPDKSINKPNAMLTLKALNCYACHERDGIGGPTPRTDPYFAGDHNLGDSGRIPPPLTGIGDKLRREWLESVFTEPESSRVRPYIKTRMPVYPGHARQLSQLLTKVDAVADAKPIDSRAGDVGAGGKLLGTLGGANCITCHDWGERQSLGIRAMDLSEIDKRLNPSWFRAYLLDPPSYRPGTLMPPLWPGGRSSVPDVLGGDTERQIGAIWEFIRNGQGLPPGFPDFLGGQFELVPKDRPIVQRTFLEGVGTRAILVGFPGDIHIAYDGADARPALVWRGRFFDAYHTWFSRSAPFERPLEKLVHAFADPPGGGGKTNVRFLGYELDDSGNPTFLSRRGEQSVRDSFSVKDGMLVRVVRWSGGDSPPPLTHPEGIQVSVDKASGTVSIQYSWEK